MADWALILGASSGFGEATSLALAQRCSGDVSMVSKLRESELRALNSRVSTASTEVVSARAISL